MAARTSPISEPFAGLPYLAFPRIPLAAPIEVGVFLTGPSVPGKPFGLAGPLLDEFLSFTPLGTSIRGPESSTSTLMHGVVGGGIVVQPIRMAPRAGTFR